MALLLRLLMCCLFALAGAEQQCLAGDASCPENVAMLQVAVGVADRLTSRRRGFAGWRRRRRRRRPQTTTTTTTTITTTPSTPTPAPTRSDTDSDIDQVLNDKDMFRSVVEASFKEADKDRSGFIEQEELRLCMINVARDIGTDDPSEDHVAEVLHELDTNRDHRLDLNEYTVFIRQVLEVMKTRASVFLMEEKSASDGKRLLEQYAAEAIYEHLGSKDGPNEAFKPQGWKHAGSGKNWAVEEEAKEMAQEGMLQTIVKKVESRQPPR